MQDLMHCIICHDAGFNFISSICSDCWKIVNKTGTDIPKVLRLLAYTIESQQAEEIRRLES